MRHLSWEQVHENERAMLAPVVWRMYSASYGRIGLIVADVDLILSEYDLWWLLFDADGNPHAFRVGKSTDYGIKMGLSGTDGSKAAKDALINAIPMWMQRPGIYGEVSHRMEEIASQAGVPVVCVEHTEKVLRKAITPLDDGIHYIRNIEGLGPVTKVMVGRPLAVPTTSYAHPRCGSFGMLVTSRLGDRLEADDSLAPWLDL
jgi:hypothetical protein